MHCPRCLRSHIASQMFAPRGKEPAVLDHLAVLFQGKLIFSGYEFNPQRQTEETNPRVALGQKKKEVCLLCPRLGVNSAVQNAFMPAFVYFLQGHILRRLHSFVLRVIDKGKPGAQCNDLKGDL